MQNVQELETTLKNTLLDLSSKIILGRRELDTLLKEKEKYLEERETETTERIDGVLKASKNALCRAQENEKTLKEYVQIVSEFTKEIVQMQEKFIKEKAEDSGRVIASHAQLQRKESELVAIEQRLQAQESIVKADIERLKRLSKEVDDKQKLLESRQEGLNQAWNEAKQKGII